MQAGSTLSKLRNFGVRHCLDRNCKLWQYFKCDYGICIPNTCITTIGVTIWKLSAACSFAVSHLFLFQIIAHNILHTNRSFATKASELKMCDSSGETFKVNNCLTRCDYTQFIISCKLFYVFRVINSPIIRSACKL